MRSTFCEAKLVVHKSSSLFTDDAAAAAADGCDKSTDESSAGSYNTLLYHNHYPQNYIPDPILHRLQQLTL